MVALMVELKAESTDRPMEIDKVEHLAYSLVEEKDKQMVVMMVGSWVGRWATSMVVWMEISMVEN
jgi:hypothetical protein